MPYDLALRGERTICVKTLSKAYGLAGLRAGYGVGSTQLILEVDKARGPFVVSSVTAAAAAAAISSRSSWLAETIAETRASRERVRNALLHRGYEVPRSAANFVFIRLPGDELDDTAGPAGALRRAAASLRECLPRGFGLRATVAPWDRMQRLLDALDLVRSGAV